MTLVWVVCCCLRMAQGSGKNRRAFVKTLISCRLGSGAGASMLSVNRLHGYLWMGYDLGASAFGVGFGFGFGGASLSMASDCVVRGLGFDCDCGCDCGGKICRLALRACFASRGNGGLNRRMQVMNATCRRDLVYSGLYCDRGGDCVGASNLGVTCWRGNGICCRGCDESDEVTLNGPCFLSVGWTETCLDRRDVHQLLPW